MKFSFFHHFIWNKQMIINGWRLIVWNICFIRFRDLTLLIDALLDKAEHFVFVTANFGHILGHIESHA